MIDQYYIDFLELDREATMVDITQSGLKTNTFRIERELWQRLSFSNPIPILMLTIPIFQQYINNGNEKVQLIFMRIMFKNSVERHLISKIERLNNIQVKNNNLSGITVFFPDCRLGTWHSMRILQNRLGADVTIHAFNFDSYDRDVANFIRQAATNQNSPENLYRFFRAIRRVVFWRLEPVPQ